jgi:hypothetical protein
MPGRPLPKRHDPPNAWTVPAAAASRAASEAAIEALNQNDRAIQDARDANLRTGLIGDKLLVVRNFAGAVITKIGTELGELGTKSWGAFREEFPKGIGMVARGAPLVLLATAIAGPAGGSRLPLPLSNHCRKYTTSC